jgi:hypothetical protein
MYDETHDEPNLRVELSENGLALAERLRDALLTSNAFGGAYAMEFGGAYGAIKVALLTTLQVALAEAQVPIPLVERLARRLYDEAVDNGESIAYQVGLWNDNVIDLVGGLR